MGTGQGKQEVIFPPLLLSCKVSPYHQFLSDSPSELHEAACSLIFHGAKLPLKQTNKQAPL